MLQESDDGDASECGIEKTSGRRKGDRKKRKVAAAVLFCSHTSFSVQLGIIAPLNVNRWDSFYQLGIDGIFG